MVDDVDGLLRDRRQPDVAALEAHHDERERGVGLTILQACDHAESLLMLRTGRAAAWYEDDVLLAGARATALDPAALAFLPASSGVDYYYGLMLPRDDPEFKALVDGTVKAQMASGTFAKLYERWFLTPILPAGDRTKTCR